MTALRIVQKPINGRLVIEVPEELQNEMLVITCEPETKSFDYQIVKTPIETAYEFKNRLNHNFNNFEMNDYNVYEQ